MRSPEESSQSQLARRVLFITRTPMLHELSGSTTFALSLLALLAQCGCRITVIVTNSASRSPRLWFRVRAVLPAGVHFVAPGFVRVGRLYLNPFSLLACARLLVRAAARWAALQWLATRVASSMGDRLTSVPWDLTLPTAAETKLVADYMQRFNATTVVVNYAFWAPLLSLPALERRRRVIMMHDLLSARVARFRAAQLPLDCPDIDAATELAWLNCADCVLAAQTTEAEDIRPRVRGTVLVQPAAFAMPVLNKVLAMTNRCLFVGSDITPNRTGLDWFLDQVWPLVLANSPTAELAVAGSVCRTFESRADTLPSVHFLGVVTSLEPEYARATICVVPLQVGSGIKIKLLEALAHGKAVVSTRIGIQGIEAWSEAVLITADTPAAFAAAIVALLRSPAERNRLGAAARVAALQHFSNDAPLAAGFLEAVLG